MKLIASIASSCALALVVSANAFAEDTEHSCLDPKDIKEGNVDYPWKYDKDQDWDSISYLSGVAIYSDEVVCLYNGSSSDEYSLSVSKPNKVKGLNNQGKWETDENGVHHCPIGRTRGYSEEIGHCTWVE